MEITGIVKYVSEIKNGISKQGNQYRILEAVIEETDKQFPDSVVVTQMNDTIDQQRLIPGRKVKAYFSPKATEYQGKYYLRASCWKIENLDVQESGQKNFAPDQSLFPPLVDLQGNGVNDDLPF